MSSGVSDSSVLDTRAAGGLIIRGGALRVGSYAGVVALSVVAVAILTRHLGVSRFGQYTTIISLVTIVSVITDVGMSTLGTREYAVRSGDDREAWMRNLLGLRVALTLAGVIFATAFVLLAGYRAALVAGAVLASLATVGLVVQHTLAIPLAAELRLGTMALLDLARQALTVIAIVALVLAGAGLLPLLSVTLVVYALLIPATARLVRISLGVELHPRRWLSLLRLTVSFSLASAVGALYVYAAQIVTSLVASAHQSGLFAASFRVFTVVATVPGLLVGSAFPLLARAERDDRERLAYATQRIFEVSLILGLAAALGVLAGAPFIIEVIAGARFAGAAPALRIVGVAMIASFLVASWGFTLLSIREYGSLLVVNGLALLVSCGLTLALAGPDGARGTAIAVLCGEFTLALGYLLVIVLRAHELRPRLAVVPKVALAAAPAAPLALAPVLPSLARALLAVGLYTLLIVLTRAVPKEVLELIPRRGPAADRPAPK